MTTVRENSENKSKYVSKLAGFGRGLATRKELCKIGVADVFRGLLVNEFIDRENTEKHWSGAIKIFSPVLLRSKFTIFFRHWRPFTSRILENRD